MAPARMKKASNTMKTIEVKKSGAKTALPPDIELSTSPSTEPEQHPTNAVTKITYNNKQSVATKSNDLDSALMDQQPQSIRPSVSPLSPKSEA